MTMKLSRALALTRCLRMLLRLTGSGGNLAAHAHLAAPALSHGATAVSADHDFQRVPGVTHFNPRA